MLVPIQGQHFGETSNFILNTLIHETNKANNTPISLKVGCHQNSGNVKRIIFSLEKIIKTNHKLKGGQEKVYLSLINAEKRLVK